MEVKFKLFDDMKHNLELLNNDWLTVYSNDSSSILSEEYKVINDLKKIFFMPNSLEEFDKKFGDINLVKNITLYEYNAIICGGSVSNVISNNDLGLGSDIDIFLYNTNATYLYKLIKEIISNFRCLPNKNERNIDEDYNFMKKDKFEVINFDRDLFKYLFGDKIEIKDHVINLYALFGENEIKRKIQIVLYKFDSIKTILNSFDMSCCQYGYDGDKLYMLSSSYITMLTKYNFIFNYNYERVLKYEKRGFITLDWKEKFIFKKVLKELIDIIDNKSKMKNVLKEITEKLVIEDKYEIV